MNEIIQKFTDAMCDAGINPTAPIIADGALHRAHVEGDRAGTLNLAYLLHLDGKPAGWWQYFKTGITGTWTLSGKREPMTATMQRQIAEARQQRQTEQLKTQQETAEKARWIWQQATPITEPAQHNYLIKKHIQPHGARLYRDALVLPLLDATGELVNLQLIYADGSKRFMKSGRKTACYSTIGEPTDTILICEGWATGASLFESTSHYVIVAMDAGNIKPVSEIVRRQYPNNKIIVCADNDTVGVEKATIAAFACDGLFIAPPMMGQDFNDFISAGGVVNG